MLKFEEQQMLCFDWNDWYTGMFLYMLTVTGETTMTTDKCNGGKYNW